MNKNEVLHLSSEGSESTDAQAMLAQMKEEILQNIDFIDEKSDDKHRDCDNKAEEEIREDAPDDGKNEDEQKCECGKFKNPQQLLKAYNELEREFTKRSQRLAQLESQSRSPYEDEQQWKEAVDKFFEKTPSAKAFAKQIAIQLIKDPQLKSERNCLDIALTRVLLDNFRTPQQLVLDGQFLDEYIYNSPDIKQTIINRYLDEVRKGTPPNTMGCEGMQCVAPKRKPRSVEEAGFMFLKDNQ